jgi:hypothetical protein
VARRPDRDRIAAAREAAVRARLVSTGQLPARADELLAEWRVQARGRGLDDRDRRYWDEAWPWLEGRLR